jgi:ATP sulfurylase
MNKGWFSTKDFMGKDKYDNIIEQHKMVRETWSSIILEPLDNNSQTEIKQEVTA